MGIQFLIKNLTNPIIQFLIAAVAILKKGNGIEKSAKNKAKTWHKTAEEVIKEK